MEIVNKILLTILMLSMLATNTVNAEANTFVEARVKVNELVAIEQYNNREKYELWVDLNGEVMDRKGNIINPSGTINLDGKLELSERYVKGEKLYFNSISDFDEFLKYYVMQYELNCIYKHFKYNIEADGKITSILDKNQRYHREAIKGKIINKFGLPVGESNYEKIYNICLEITNMDYSLNFIMKDLDTALNDNSCVCWHYAKIAAILLNESGIYTEVVFGSLESNITEGHMWIRCLVDEKWIYADPTLCKSAWLGYSNIDYALYTKLYSAEKHLQTN